MTDYRRCNVEAHCLQYEGLGSSRTGVKLTKDSNGLLEYSKPAVWVTTGGFTAGGFVNVGVRPESGDNVAILARDVIISSVSCIELQRIPFACALSNFQAEATLPLSCLMTVQPMRLGSNGEPEPIPNAAAQTFDFTPQGNLEYSLFPFSILAKMKVADINIAPAKMFKISFISADTATVSGAVGRLPSFLQQKFFAIFGNVGNIVVDGFADSIKYKVSTCDASTALHKRTEQVDTMRLP